MNRWRRYLRYEENDPFNAKRAAAHAVRAG
jgi:hypothetical protein